MTFWHWGLWLFIGGLVLNGILYIASATGFAIKEKTRQVALDGEQLATINCYFNVPVYVDDEVLADINEHNQEAKLEQG
jgi:hypothetical protein